ncbi:MAG: DUF4367 domain-containing protein [Oscillospiraceae bacterium]|nr:DUF4367 domain-containing protein [Oscillospiraceae bacterium]
MDQKILLEILKTKPFSFTLREIEEILDEELSKAPDEMDTEIIDICVDILDREYSKENAASKPKKQKIKKFKARRVLLIAAILILALVLSISAGAKFLNIDASEKVVRFMNNHFNVNFGDKNTDADNYFDNGLELINYLNDYGFENVVLPSALINDDYSMKINTFSLENIEKAFIEFKSYSTNVQGDFSITKYSNSNDLFTIGQGSMSDTYDQVKQIFVNGIDVLIFNSNNNSMIYYIDSNIEYYITINCDFDLAIEIAETIK